MRAGTAEVPLPLPLEIPLMGYGARRGVARAERDRLHARALYLENEGRVLLVSLEVCLVSVPQARALAEALARETGLARHEIWIAATHTHSGPETGVAAALSGEPEPPWLEPLWAAAREAGSRAVREASPARIGLGSARTTIGRNRRAVDGFADPEAVVLRVDAADGRPRAIAFVHGTHPTVLGHENLDWSADWPGAAGAVLREAFPGAVPIFLLGAHGDVDPRTRGLQDLAVPGQSLGAGFDACEALGREAGEAVAAAAARIETLADLPVSSRAATLELAVHGAEPDGRGYDAALANRRREAAEALGLDADAALRVSQVFALEAGATAGLATAERRERLARGRLFVRDRTGPRLAGGVRPAVELHGLALGPARWLGLPLEATAEVGRDWKQGRAPGSALLSNVGGWLRYLPHARRFRAPDAHHHYEVLMSTFEPGAAERLLAAGAAAIEPAA